MKFTDMTVAELKAALVSKTGDCDEILDELIRRKTLNSLGRS